jgi:predicted thioesterase
LIKYLKVTWAELVAVDGRSLIFKVEFHDEREKVGEGNHHRAIINLDRFMARLHEKAKTNER